MQPTATYPSLSDRAVLITGGATGIGEALVSACARQGMLVAFIDLAADAGKALAIRLAAEPGVRHPPQFAAADLTDVHALRSTIKTLRDACGPFHGLVNNAANDTRHRIEDTTPETWDAGVAVNLKHQFFCAQALMDDMRAAGGGSIVNLGSVSWMLKQGGMPVYTTAKSAVQGLTRSLARDLGPHGIRVNTVVSGWIMTDRQRRLWATPQALADVQRVQCLKGEMEPWQIASMVLFLLADDSAMCTAQDFIVDAGWA